MNPFIQYMRGFVSRNVGYIAGVIFLVLILVLVLVFAGAFINSNKPTGLDEKEKVEALVASLDDNARSIESWLKKNRTLGRVFLSEDGRVCTPEETICRLPQNEDVTWDIEVDTRELIVFFEWTKDSGCRPKTCNGYWSISFEEETIKTEANKVQISPREKSGDWKPYLQSEDEVALDGIEYISIEGEEVFVWRATVTVKVGGSPNPLGLNKSESRRLDEASSSP